MTDFGVALEALNEYSLIPKAITQEGADLIKDIAMRAVGIGAVAAFMKFFGPDIYQKVYNGDPVKMLSGMMDLIKFVYPSSKSAAINAMYNKLEAALALLSASRGTKGSNIF